MEVWAKIDEFENYIISTKGHVKSLNYNNTGKEQILKPKINKHNGILEVTLNKGNKHYYRTVCRLVLKTFLGIELGKNDIVMYRDNDKTNCELENLYIITRGKRQELTYDLDKRYRPKYEYYGQILPTKQIAKINNIEPKLIRQRIRNLYWNIYESAEIPKGIYKKGGE